jgi:inward rectifier potassium channel
MSWRKLFACVTSVYLTINLVFGTAYYLEGEHALRGLQAATPFDHWVECFFFSVQTLATIGYGGISPNSIYAHLLVTVEALVGLIGLALITGIVFSRFSRPTARVRFSDQALITRIDGIPSLVFRMANTRLNQIVEAQVRVALARSEMTCEGLVFREFYDLSLERERSPLFAMTWTIIHPIGPESPLYGQTRESIREMDTEIIVTVIGMDETFSQTVHSRFSYASEEIEWNLIFEDMVSLQPDGKLRVELEKMSRTRALQAEPVVQPIA